ncbi:MAG: serine/threonine-protein kinase [Nostoc sp.]|uniref:serine/threonine-protein kinase n=1 Tax=Nostoc sp. TaxID=1180 RepID=UPI002FF443CF
MSLCINPNCQNTDNPDNLLHCQSCGSELLLEGCYRVTRPIGQGGFAKTFEVSDRGKLKILKVLTHNQTKVVSLFQQEAEVLKRLNHPGIPNAEEYFKFFPQNSQEPVHCLVMDKIEGENLHEWLEKRGNRPISEKQAILWLTQLANILHEVHQQQFFHRDIKPSNIMLTADGQLVLIDFGIAREITGTYEKKQAAGQITKFVSDGYAPLEQITGHAVPQSDFFALGRTFVHLLIGKCPLELMDDPYGDPYTTGLNWRVEVNHISPLLADFIDHLMMQPVKDRPANTQVILEKLVEINNILYPPKQANPKLINQQTALKLQKITLESIIGDLSSWHSSPVNSVAISPDGEILASGSTDGKLKVWNLQRKEEIYTLTEHSASVNCVAISPDGKTLVSGSEDMASIIWNLKTGEFIQRFGGHSKGVTSVAFHPTKQILFTASLDNIIKQWDLKTEKRTHTHARHLKGVTSLAVSPNGQSIASGSYDHTIIVWTNHTLTGHKGVVRSVAISPDGHTLVSGSDDTEIKVWNLISGELISTLTGHLGSVLSVAISPDGQTLVSGSQDKTIKLWNLSTGEEINSVIRHLDAVNSLVFSPDGQTIFSGSQDSTIKMWRIN